MKADLGKTQGWQISRREDAMHAPILWDNWQSQEVFDAEEQTTEKRQHTSYSS